MSQRFYTIDGIDDDVMKPTDPEVIKFFDRKSAEDVLKLFIEHGLCPFNCFVGEHHVV